MNSLPQELVDRVIDWACLPTAPTKEEELTSNKTARACSLVRFSWNRRSRQKLFRAVSLNPERLVRWCENIPNSASGPSSFVRMLSLERLTADHLLQHIEHIEAFKHIAILYLGFFDDETFDQEKIERCFGHFGPTVHFLSFLFPQCKASLFPRLLGLFTRAIRIDINMPHIIQDVDETEYKPLPNLELLGLGLEQNASIDYELLEACTNLRAACISCPRSTARFWFNHLFIRCADTLESVLIGPEYQGKFESYSHAQGFLANLSYFTNTDPIEYVLPVPDDIPLATHWSMAQCANIRDLDVAVEPKGPGALAEEIITSAPIAKLRSICLIFDCKVKADFSSRVKFEAWEALESHLCYVADKKLKKDPPERFAVTIFFTPHAKKYIMKDGGEVRLGKFLDGLQRRGVLEVKVS